MGSKRQFMTTFRKFRGSRDWVARDAQQAVLAALLIVFVAAASLSDGKIIPDFFGGAGNTKGVGPVPDDELKTGSIYITSPDGSLCEHRLIDNATWRIRPNGYVACDEAIAGAAQTAA